MKCNIISIGHKPTNWESEGIKYYVKQLPKNCLINFIDIKGKQHPKMKKGEVLKLEKELILDKLDPANKIIVCDISGKKLSSINLSRMIQKSLNINEDIAFIIGGSYGLSEEIVKKANFILSVSDLTFPHRLFKMMLIEQIYRSFSIINNMPYHK